MRPFCKHITYHSDVSLYTLRLSRCFPLDPKRFNTLLAHQPLKVFSQILLYWFEFGLDCNSKATFIWIWIFISSLRVLSTPPGPIQALNPKTWTITKVEKLQRTTTPLLLSSSRTATRLAADVVCLSYSPACLQLHQGLLLPRLMLYPLFSEFGGSSTNLLLVF